MKFKGYRFGVEWIARNDEAGELDLETIQSIISVALLADITGKTTEEVARDVQRCREKIAKNEG